MTADMMFEDLGYKMYEWQGVGCTYYKQKRRIHFFYDDPRGTVENGNGYVQPNKKEKEAIKQKLKEIRKCQ